MMNYWTGFASGFFLCAAIVAALVVRYGRAM
jgi:hypothetical protein